VVHCDPQLPATTHFVLVTCGCILLESPGYAEVVVVFRRGVVLRPDLVNGVGVILLLLLTVTVNDVILLLREVGLETTSDRLLGPYL
jgi:hypothetical protein